MDESYLEHSERRSQFRIGLTVLAGFFILAGTVPWVLGVREQRKLQWAEELAWDRYRLEGRGRDAMRVHVEQNLPQDRAEQQIALMGLDRPPAGPEPPQPRRLSFRPPMITVSAYLLAAAAVLGADGIRRRQLADLQVVADAQRAARAAREAMGEGDTAGAREPAGGEAGGGPTADA